MHGCVLTLDRMNPGDECLLWVVCVIKLSTYFGWPDLLLSANKVAGR